MRLPGSDNAPGKCSIATNKNIMTPTRSPDHCTWILVAMLNAAATSATPTKYTQNIRHGM